MSKVNDGGPAYPCVTTTEPEDRGMSLRDYFAALAMQSIVRNSAESYSASASRVAEKAYMMADGMIAERVKVV